MVGDTKKLKEMGSCNCILEVLNAVSIEAWHIQLGIILKNGDLLSIRRHCHESLMHFDQFSYNV